VIKIFITSGLLLFTSVVGLYLLDSKHSSGGDN